MLAAPERTKIIKLLRMFSSHHVGERGSAAAMVHRIITAAKLDWDDVIRLSAPPPYVAPPPPPEDREAARAIFRNRAWTTGLSDPEIDIILVCASLDEPSERQRAALARVLAKIQATYANARRD